MPALRGGTAVCRVVSSGPLLVLRPGVRAQSRRYVGLHHHRRPAADWRDYRPDLFRSRAFAPCGGADDDGGVRGAAALDGPQPLGRGDRAALLVASVLARARGSAPPASCDAPSLTRPG